MAGDEERLSVERLQRLMEERRVSVAELPPILMPQLDPERLPDLRLVSVGGEAAPASWWTPGPPGSASSGTAAARPRRRSR